MKSYPNSEPVRGPESAFIVALIITAGIGLPSALLYALPIGQRVIGFLLLVMTLGYFAASGRRIPLSWAIALLFGVLLSTVTAFYWGDSSIVFVLGYIVLGVCLVGMATLAEVTKAVRMASVIMLVVVALAWIAVIYAMGGGGPVWNVGNPGQPLSLYLSSLALSIHGQRVGNLIRPAGIFDEPGALAFFVSSCAACRMLLDMPKRTTWALMLGGLVTASLALLVFILIAGVGEAFSRSRPRIHAARGHVKQRGWLLASAVSLLLLVFVVRYYSEISLVVGFLFGRLEFSSGGGRIVAGDSRTAQMLDAVRSLNVRVFFFGTSDSCFKDFQQCAQLGLGGGNPLWPLVVRGLFSQFLYYFILCVMIVRGVLEPKRAAVYLAVVLMFFQRPYVLALGYSIWAALIVMMEVKKKQAWASVLPVRNAELSWPSEGA